MSYCGLAIGALAPDEQARKDWLVRRPNVTINENIFDNRLKCYEYRLTCVEYK